MVIRRPISRLKETAKNRAPGYLDACLQAGKLVEGDEVEFTREAFEQIRAAFKPVKLGLGDAVERYVGQPVAKSIDGALGTGIQYCAGCAMRVNFLNTLAPDLANLLPSQKSDTMEK